MGIIAGVIAIGSAVIGAVGKNKARKQKEKAAEAQARINKMRMEREIGQFKAETNVQKAELTAASAAQGISSSSLAGQAQASLQTQFDTEINYLEETAELGAEVTRRQNKADEILGKTEMVQSIFDVAGGFAESFAKGQ